MFRKQGNPRNMATNQALFESAEQCIPGGVNSPVRAFRGVGGTPIFFEKSDGPYLYDTNGKQYTDYVCSWGPIILGHNHPKVKEATIQAVEKGLSYGAPSPTEIEMAQLITHLMPNIEKVRMTNSGTEATLSAIRLARGFTHRDKIIKFQGCYHGHGDSLLVKAGSGGLTFGVPDSAGVPESIAQHTLTAPFNDLNAVEQMFQSMGNEIAAVIVEPVAANMNLILPQDDFLSGLRRLCDQYQSVLIFDEVMTGFRVALGGAQSLYQIKPDLTCLGKVIGGGLPVGAFGGRADIMDKLAPLGPVYQAGTLSGNPVTLAAGLANLKGLQEPGAFDRLSKLANHFTDGLETIAHACEKKLQATALGGFFGFTFGLEQKPKSFSDIEKSDIEFYKQFFHQMLQRGVYFAPSAYEVGFVTLAHTEEVIDDTLNKMEDVLSK